MRLASKLPEAILQLIFDKLPHRDILSAAAISRHWRDVAKKHPRFFLCLSLVHGAHAAVPLRSNPRHLRFVAALCELAMLKTKTPIAVRLEVWTSDPESGDAACLLYTILPALRAAMPYIHMLDVRLPREVLARETFGAAPLLRELVLGVTSGADPQLLVHPRALSRIVPALESLRLQGLRICPRAAIRSESTECSIVVDSEKREDRPLTMFELIDVERGPYPEDWWLDADSDSSTHAVRLYYQSETQVAYSPGLDVTPLFRRRVSLMRLTGISPLTARFESGTLSATLTAEAPSAPFLLSSLAACMPSATILTLELHTASASQFFDAFSGTVLPHTRALKISHDSRHGASDALRTLVSLLSSRGLGGGGSVRFPALRKLELEWVEDAELRHASRMTTDQALRVAAALGLRGRVRLELWWIEVRGGSRDAGRVFRDVFEYR